MITPSALGSAGGSHNKTHRLAHASAPRRARSRHTYTNSRRAFSLMIVMAAMVFAATAITALSLVFATDARRTRAALATPQLRQLLLAAIPAAQDELTSHGTTPRDVTIATPLPGATLTMHIAPGPTPPPPTTAPTAPAADSADVRITAEFKSFHAAQIVHFTRQPNTQPVWTIQQAHLDQMPIQ